MTTTATELPLVLAEVSVASVERLSPSFVRIALGGPELAHIGVDGPWWDQRFKIILPTASGAITSIADADASWLSTWMERPVEERGHMRTYTVRDVVGSGADTQVVVDIVIHPGASGPGGDWAARAAVGDKVVVLLPKRGHHFGGIEFTNPPGADLLLVGDESAVPAICAILELLPPEARGAAFMEVPEAADFQTVRRPQDVEVTWLARGERPHGEALHEAVLAHLGTASASTLEVEADEVDPDLWETPTWSSSGEQLDSSEDMETTGVGDLSRLHAWIAGESAMVTGLRRHLVKELGVDRKQVAFMGYWRRGVPMKS